MYLDENIRPVGSVVKNTQNNYHASQWVNASKLLIVMYIEAQVRVEE